MDHINFLSGSSVDFFHYEVVDEEKQKRKSRDVAYTWAPVVLPAVMMLLLIVLLKSQPAGGLCFKHHPLEDIDEIQNQSASVPAIDSTVNDAKYVFCHLSDVRQEGVDEFKCLQRILDQIEMVHTALPVSLIFDLDPGLSLFLVDDFIVKEVGRPLRELIWSIKSSKLIGKSTLSSLFSPSKLQMSLALR
ncbi:hypothetical protein PIB30_074737 [Stylosanthes scabra]|uniref:Uncharacterized protein n=1 Tax=Stylosanthes scabra TaxID=79078 RepID=A0ABU6QS18_9FABA|nr:hypothetical protein [Stylosanthes scabra]